MSMESSTLKVGDKAPDFTLAAGNVNESFSLKSLIRNGPVILEFLRGTW